MDGAGAQGRWNLAHGAASGAARCTRHTELAEVAPPADAETRGGRGRSSSVLGDPSRCRLVYDAGRGRRDLRLRSGGRRLAMSESNVSHHLRVLRAPGWCATAARARWSSTRPTTSTSACCSTSPVEHVRPARRGRTGAPRAEPDGEATRRDRPRSTCPVLLPRGAECAELRRRARRRAAPRSTGVRDVEADVARGLVHVQLRQRALTLRRPRARRPAHRRPGALRRALPRRPPTTAATAPAPSRSTPRDERAAMSSASRTSRASTAPTAPSSSKARCGTAPGVVGASMSFGAATLKLVFDPARSPTTRSLERVRRLGYDTLEGKQERAVRPPLPGRPLAFAVHGMDCADCARRLETRAAAAVDGVDGVRVDFALARLDGERSLGADRRDAAPRCTAPPMSYGFCARRRRRRAAAGPLRGRRADLLTAASGVSVVAGFAAEALAAAAPIVLFAAAMVARRLRSSPAPPSTRCAPGRST